MAVLAALLAAAWFTLPHLRPHARQAARPSAPSAAARINTPHARFGRDVGFRSREVLVEHFDKHGRELDAFTPEAYLRLAQDLRDRPVGGSLQEIVRSDGVSTRFDRASGAFLAFGPDGTIRTFFKPNRGQEYFLRQAAEAHP
jgi:pyocin large subunit-like protein